MKLPRVRFTVRRLMVAVAVVAIVLTGISAIQAERWRRLADQYSRESEYFRWFEKHAKDFATRCERDASYNGEKATLCRGYFREYDDPRFEEAARAFESNASRMDLEAQRQSRQAKHYAALVRKFHHATRYPWLPVAPDPPEPE